MAPDRSELVLTRQRCEHVHERTYFPRTLSVFFLTGLLSSNRSAFLLPTSLSCHPMSNSKPSPDPLPTSLEDTRFFSLEGGPSSELDALTGSQAVEMLAFYARHLAPQIATPQEEPIALISMGIDLSILPESSSTRPSTRQQSSKAPKSSQSKKKTKASVSKYTTKCVTHDSVIIDQLSLPLDWENTVDEFLALQFSRSGLKSLAGFHEDSSHRLSWMFRVALRPPTNPTVEEDVGKESCFTPLHHFAIDALVSQISAILLCEWNSSTDRKDEQQVKRLNEVAQLIINTRADYQISIQLQPDGNWVTPDFIILKGVGIGADVLLAMDLKSRFVADHGSPSSPSLDTRISIFLASYIGKSLRHIFNKRKMTKSSNDALALHLIAQVCFLSSNGLLANRLSDPWAMYGGSNSYGLLYFDIYLWADSPFTKWAYLHYR